MFGKDPVSDRVLSQKVSEHLQNRGMRAPCQLVVTSQKGTVTISGKIQYEHQRRVAMHTTQSIEGVRRVVDRMQVIAKTMHWK